MFEREKVVNVFAGIGVVSTLLFSVLGLGALSGRVKVSITRPKKEVVTPAEESKLNQVE